MWMKRDIFELPMGTYINSTCCVFLATVIFLLLLLFSSLFQFTSSFLCKFQICVPRHSKKLKGETACALVTILLLFCPHFSLILVQIFAFKWINVSRLNATMMMMMTTLIIFLKFMLIVLKNKPDDLSACAEIFNLKFILNVGCCVHKLDWWPSSNKSNKEMKGWWLLIPEMKLMKREENSLQIFMTEWIERRWWVDTRAIKMIYGNIHIYLWIFVK
jgi:hypothetical protein